MHLGDLREFHKGLEQSTNAVKLEQTIKDMDAGGRTPSQALAARAKAVGIDPTGMEPEELTKKSGCSRKNLIQRNNHF